MLAMDELVENRLLLDPDSVWVRAEAKAFDYSDGVGAERYLEEVLSSSADLSFESVELEQRITDWPSRYHLARARAQLLKPFDFGGSKRVLEVGCGCGAITRFLGETFAQVISIEGSHARARLARMRTKDLDNVAIVNSPFQEIRFKVKFDIIFCIGVFEYSNVFVESDDPHRAILDYFSGLLAPNGMLVLAIENKFGLKYFGSSAEDHTAVMHDGIEGYPRRPDGPKTFGQFELRSLLQERFDELAFYYPVPDYKMPACVISERMLEKVDTAELLGSSPSVDYGNPGRKPLFDEQLAWCEISRNRMIPTFANSFLVLAGKDSGAPIRNDWLAVAYSNRRRREFSTETRFLETGEHTVRVLKSRVDGNSSYAEGKLEHRGWEGEWINGVSLQLLMARRAREKMLRFREIFMPSKAWFHDLESSSSEEDGGKCVTGDRLDSIWRNCFIENGQCRYIDQEWVWRERLPLKLVVARGLYYFAKSLLGRKGLNPALQGMRVSRLISSAASFYGLRLSRKDLRELARFEAQFLQRTSAKSASTAKERMLDRLDVSLVLRRRLEPAAPRRYKGWMRKGLRRAKRALLRSRR
jgi:SAM-dependent methyltransferase